MVDIPRKRISYLSLICFLNPLLRKFHPAASQYPLNLKHIQRSSPITIFPPFPVTVVTFVEAVKQSTDFEEIDTNIDCRKLYEFLPLLFHHVKVEI